MDKNEEGWLFAIPSNNNHLHATWWTVDEDNAKRWLYANSNVTTGICCFIFEYYKKESELYKEAVGYINNKISMISENKLFDEFTVGAYKNLLENIKELGLEKEFDIYFLTQALEKMGKSEDIIGNNPDKIIEDRQENGVWDIPWTWKEYPEEFAVAKNW